MFGERAPRGFELTSRLSWVRSTATPASTFPTVNETNIMISDEGRLEEVDGRCQVLVQAPGLLIPPDRHLARGTGDKILALLYLLSSLRANNEVFQTDESSLERVQKRRDNLKQFEPQMQTNFLKRHNPNAPNHVMYNSI